MPDSNDALEAKYEPGRSYLLKGALINALVRGLRLQRVIPGPGLHETGTPLGRVIRGTEVEPKRGRFEVYRQGEKLYVAPGSVSYVEVPTRDHDDTPPAVITRPLIPTLDGDDLDDPDEAPFFELGSRDDGTVWLIVQQTRCSGLYASDTDEPERIELTDRGEDPETLDGEHAIPLVSFDIEDGRMTNIKRHHESDWTQWYRCDGDFDPSNDSRWGSDGDSDPSVGSGGSGGGSGSGDGDDGEGCSVSMSAKWLNRVDCFNKAGGFGADFECVPGAFTFIFEVTFTGVDPFGQACEHWAYGVKMPGSSSPEAVWLDASRKIVSFTWQNAPACDKPVLVWRARGFGPLKDESGDVIPSCCGKLFGGQVPKVPKKLPPVCECTCSSSSALDDPPEGP